MRSFDVKKSVDGQQLVITQTWPAGVKFERTINIASIIFIDGYGLIAVDAGVFHNNTPTYIVGVVDKDCNVVLNPENGVLNALLLKGGNVIISAVDPTRGIFDTTQIHYSLSSGCPKMYDLQRDSTGNLRPCVWAPCSSTGVILKKPYSQEVIGYYDTTTVDILETIPDMQPDTPSGSYILKQ